MARGEALSPQSRAELFGLATHPTEIVRHYTFSADELGLIHERRRRENRLGFAVQWAYLKYPGRLMRPDEAPQPIVLDFIADQLGINPNAFVDYAGRITTRREHAGELLAMLGLRPTTREDYRPLTLEAANAANGTDRADLIVLSLIEYLRSNKIILPRPAILERIALSGRQLACQRAYRDLISGITAEQQTKLEKLLEIEGDTRRSRLAWLRGWTEAPSPPNLIRLYERLSYLRKVGIEPTRSNRIHAARFQALVRETRNATAQHLSDAYRPTHKLAALVTLAIELEATLTDATIAMFDKQLGVMFNRAKWAAKEKIAERALDLKTANDIVTAGCEQLIKAREQGQDGFKAIDDSVGWDHFVAAVNGSKSASDSMNTSTLDELVADNSTLRRFFPGYLQLFEFECWRPDDPLITAINDLRMLYASGSRGFIEAPRLDFLTTTWTSTVTKNGDVERKSWEMAIAVSLRERIRAGDIWVTGSRAYRAFKDYLLPQDAYDALRAEGRLGLSVSEDWDTYLNERKARLEARLCEVSQQAAVDALEGVSFNNEQLRISPIRADQPVEAEQFARFLSGRLPRVRITDLLDDVNRWTGFCNSFTHLQSGAVPKDVVSLLSAVLADATNLGLDRMAEAAPGLTHSKLLTTAQNHIRDETYQAALAVIVDAIHAHPYTSIWGDGDTSSSDGQFYRAGGRGAGSGEVNARYGTEPGVLFYTHISDRYAPFYTKVIAATLGEAAHVLDGLMMHESSVDIREHYTDTGGAVERVFALCHLLGYRFIPRIKNLKDRLLFVLDRHGDYGPLAPMIGGTIDIDLIRENWPEILLLGASLRAGTVAPSIILKKLASYPRQNQLALALRELGRLERTLFTLDWISQPDLRLRSHAGLNKGEARNALARAVFFNRLGELRDRTFENQRFRASGLNLVVASIILWNTVYLSRAVQQIRERGEALPDELLPHASPLGWDHISLTGDYIWPDPTMTGDGYRPLREPKSPFLIVRH